MSESAVTPFRVPRLAAINSSALDSPALHSPVAEPETAVQETAEPQTIVRPKTVDPEPLKKPGPPGKKANPAKTKTRRQPPYAVVLHNDPKNGMDHVVLVLRKVFGYSRTKSVWLMMKAHVSGKSQVWSGVLEVAELKADQIRSCGPDPAMASQGAGTLSVSIEPLD